MLLLQHREGVTASPETPVCVAAGLLAGIEAHPVTVEVDFVNGLPGLDVVGLPEPAVRESRVRVNAAIEASGWKLRKRRRVINLAPGNLRKKGTSFDVSIAVGLLAAEGICASEGLSQTLMLGELSLGGNLRPVRGTLAQLRAAAARALRHAIVPRGNEAEAALATGIEVYVADHLREVVAFLNGDATLEVPAQKPDPTRRPLSRCDLADVRGQPVARRALEVAAAGHHHLLLLGPPGTGKTMLSRRLPGILPPPTSQEALEIATIAGAAGLTPPRGEEGMRRPFRAPHPTASVSSLVGGGDPVRPGEVTLAHGGVLFLDEFPEFHRDAIESLRTVMEQGAVHICRVRERVQMPARPLVVAAMNPCPCGFFGDPQRVCECTPTEVKRYRQRLSGPLLDRFDMQLVVPRLPTYALRAEARGESTATVRDRIVQARHRTRIGSTAHSEFETLTRVTSARGLALLDRASETLGLSTRAYVRALRIARTVAALEGEDSATHAHVSEALQYRLFDRVHGAGQPAERFPAHLRAVDGRP